MRRGTKYFCGICVIIAIFAVSNYIFYKSALRHFEQMQISSEKKTYEEFEAYVSEKVDSKYKELEEKHDQVMEDNISAGTTEYDKLGVQTVYQIESYDSLRDTTVVEYETLPEELIGLTRELADEYCKNYMKNLPAEEFLKGLQSMGITSFSNERLVVKKIYDSSKVSPDFIFSTLSLYLLFHLIDISVLSCSKTFITFPAVSLSIIFRTPISSAFAVGTITLTSPGIFIM